MKDIYKKINNLINSGEFDRANILLLPLLKKDPNDFQLVQSQFLIFLSKKDEVNALKSLYKMSELKEHYVVYNNIGNLEKNFGNYEKVRTDSCRMINLCLHGCWFVFCI